MRWLIWKTGIVSALTALVVALRFDFAWAAAYASASLFGMLNWLLLAGALVSIVKGRALVGLLCIKAKIILLATYFLLVIVPTGFVFSAFILGYSTFLIVVTLQAIGALVLGAMAPRADGGSKIAHLRTILIGPSGDA